MNNEEGLCSYIDLQDGSHVSGVVDDPGVDGLDSC